MRHTDLGRLPLGIVPLHVARGESDLVSAGVGEQQQHLAVVQVCLGAVDWLGQCEVQLRILPLTDNLRHWVDRQPRDRAGCRCNRGDQGGHGEKSKATHDVGRVRGCGARGVCLRRWVGRPRFCRRSSVHRRRAHGRAHRRARGWRVDSGRPRSKGVMECALSVGGVTVLRSRCSRRACAVVAVCRDHPWTKHSQCGANDSLASGRTVSQIHT